MVSSSVVLSRPSAPDHTAVLALMQMPHEARSAQLSQTPDHQVAAIVHATLGTTHYPAVLAALAPERIPRVVLTDLVFFDEVGELYAWKRLGLQGVTKEEFGAELAARTEVVTSPTGAPVRKTFILDPGRCWDYLIALTEVSEQEQIVELLSVDTLATMIAFVLACVNDGELELEDDDVDSVSELFADAWYVARSMLERLDRLGVEQELMGPHLDAMKEAFGKAAGYASDVLSNADTVSANDLLEALDLGD